MTILSVYNKPSIKGQAMIETLLTILLFTAIFFAALQLCVLVVNDLITNEAAFTVARVAAVTDSKTESLENKTKISAAIALLPNLSAKNLIYIPTDVSISEKSDESRRLVRYDIELNYLTRIMFASFLNPFSDRLYFGGGINAIKNTSRVRTVKSPDEDYYRKAYKNAKSYDEIF